MATGNRESNNDHMAHSTAVLVATLLLGPLLAMTVYRWMVASPCGSLYGWNSPTTAYNHTSPYSKTITHNSRSVVELRLALVTDSDGHSKKDDNHWVSLLHTATLRMDKAGPSIDIQWDPNVVALRSSVSKNGRAMELSDLKMFNGELLSVDDRTGFIYMIQNQTVIPWLYLADGNGRKPKHFKAEWMTVKNNQLFVGGIGKEWTTTDGIYVNDDPLWIKIIDHDGYVKHVDWKEPYKKLRRAVGIEYPGYMIHESAQWSDQHCQWFFLPRRASNESYSEADDEKRATNVLLRADSCFSTVTVTQIERKSTTRGFSAFQFIPFTDDTLIVAVKSEEVDGYVNSYLTVFQLDGKVLLADMEIPGHEKYEGVEFI